MYYPACQNGLTDATISTIRATRRKRFKAIHECKFCPFVTNDVKLHKQHESYHSSLTIRFTCLVCNALFSSSGACQKHARNTSCNGV